MPRRHIRKPDSRKYGYDVAAMQAAISDVNEKVWKKLLFCINSIEPLPFKQYLNRKSWQTISINACRRIANSSCITETWGLGFWPWRPAVQSIDHCAGISHQCWETKPIQRRKTWDFSNFHVPLCQISQLTAASVSNSMIIQEDYHFCQKAS